MLILLISIIWIYQYDTMKSFLNPAPTSILAVFHYFIKKFFFKMHQYFYIIKYV